MLGRTAPTAIGRPGTVTVRIRALQEELDSLQLTAEDLSLNVSGMGGKPPGSADA